MGQCSPIVWSAHVPPLFHGHMACFFVFFSVICLGYPALRPHLFDCWIGLCSLFIFFFDIAAYTQSLSLLHQCLLVLLIVQSFMIFDFELNHSLTILCHHWHFVFYSILFMCIHWPFPALKFGDLCPPIGLDLIVKFVLWILFVFINMATYAQSLTLQNLFLVGLCIELFFMSLHFMLNLEPQVLHNPGHVSSIFDFMLCPITLM